MILCVAFAAACSDDATLSDTPQKGSEGAACYENGACNDGLVCASQICVRPPNAGSQDVASHDAADAAATDTGEATDAQDARDTRDTSGSGDASALEDSADSAGSDTGEADAGAGEPPRAEIWHPSDGQTRIATRQIPFSGRGFDAEDGQLSGASLVWTSSIDGQFGTGKSFKARLSAGTNVVTLTVTDSDGNRASTSITLNIQ